MKYVIVLGDGMADYPVPELGDKTPLEAANKPNMDYIAQHGTVGMVQTVPDGMSPGSDTANMSVMGYTPKLYYTGRSPLEAVSMGIDVKPDDVTFRCNLVTVSDEPNYDDKIMIDYSSDEISTEEARILVDYLAENLTDDDLKLYCGISYRHCLVLSHGQTGSTFTPPHDITGKPVRGHLPSGLNGDRLYAIMKRSYDLLKDHPINLARVAQGKHPANSAWFWGEGTKPKLDSLESLYGIKGGVICAVDLIKGLGMCAGMRNIPVEGATGGMVTNYLGKGKAALELLRDGCDLVYIHIEAPDECGHHGDAKVKVEAIEAIDRDVLGMIMDELKRDGEDFSILLTPDHPTPIAIKTHTGEPVPFVLYRSAEDTEPSTCRYTEAEAKSTGLFLSEGPMLMKKLVNSDF